MAVEQAEETQTHIPTLEEEVLAALQRSPRHLLPKLIYDGEGSQLYDRILHLAEYYPPRMERWILKQHRDEMADVLGPELRVFEPGSGSSDRVASLLEALHEPVSYVPVERAEEAVMGLARRLRERFPQLEVQPLVRNFWEIDSLPAPTRPVRGTVAFYPGSSIGNFLPDVAARLLRRLHRLGGENTRLLVGIDLDKDPRTLCAAYSDAEGVTEAFERNVLQVMNHRLKGDFDDAAFDYRVRHDLDNHRVVMQLVSRIDQRVRVAGESFDLRADEPLVTEYSYKPRIEDFEALVQQAGLRVSRVWTDPQQWYAVCLIEG